MNKKVFLPVLIVLSLSIVQSCSMMCKKGRGKVATETRTLAVFDKLEIEGQAEVILVQGTEPSVRISIDSNLLEFVKTKVSGTELKIYESKCLKEISEFKIYITTANLSEISIEGAVKLTCDSVLRTKSLKLETDNSGEVKLNIETEDFEVVTNGSGLLKLSGRTDDLDISLKGAGSIQGFDLISKNADLKVTGACSCEISVSEKLTAKVSESGNLFYKGNPKKVQTSNSGTGTIQTK